MADAMQGIMSLGAGAPESAPPSPSPELSPEAIQGLTMAQGTGDARQATSDAMDTIQEADPELVLQFRQMLASVDMPDELLDAMGKMVDAVLADPSRYAELRQEFIKEGVPEDLLPPEFDPAYFMAFNVVLDEIADAKTPTTQAFASGGIATLNPVMQGIAKMGRAQDTQLAHIMPSEARMLRRYGGSGTVNPRTGLREFGFFSGIAKAVGGAFKAVGKAVKGVVNVVKSAVKSITSSTIGRIALTMAAVYFLGPMVAQYTAGTAFAGVSSGITAGLANTGIALASGANLKDALKQGVIAGVTAQAVQYGGEKLGFIKPTTPAPGSAPSVGPGDSQIDDYLYSKGLANKTTDAGLATPELTSADAVLKPASEVMSKGYATTQEPLLSPAESIARAQAAPSMSNLDSITKAQLPPPPVSGPGLVASKSTLGSAVDGSGFKLSGADLANKSYALSDAAPTPSLYDTVANKVSNAYQGTKDIYNQYLSPSGIQSRGSAEAMAKVQEMFPTVTPEQIAQAPANSIIGEAYRNALPGTLATYGPLAATIGAGAYAAGAFEGQPAEKPETPQLGSDVFAANPQDYLVNQGGVNTQYYGGIQGAQYGPQKMKTGGIADLPTKYPRKNGPINGPGTGTSDDIPAMLSDGEFVFTAKAVRNMGGGSRRLGAKRMYTMMKALEKRSA